MCFPLDYGRNSGTPPQAANFESCSMAYSSGKPVPLLDGHSHQQSRTSQADNHASASHNVPIFVAERKKREAWKKWFETVCQNFG